MFLASQSGAHFAAFGALTALQSGQSSSKRVDLFVVPNDALDTEEEWLHTLQNSKSQGDDDENDVKEGSDSSDEEGSSAEDND
jgi:hypothetical protein